MIYGVPMGCDFVKEAVLGLLERHRDPLELTRVIVVVNSGRFAARFHEEISKYASLAPKVLTMDAAITHFLPKLTPTFSSSLAGDVLDLAALLEKLAASSDMPIFNTNARFEIAYSLLDLLNQTVERGLEPDALNMLDIGDFAQHWQLNSKFFSVLSAYWKNAKSGSLLHLNLERIDEIATAWKASPHADPFYIIGSTGSRPIMRNFMHAVLELPRSAIVLPAVDFAIDDALPADHAQFGNHDLCQSLGYEKIEHWHGIERPIAKFIQVALAPAPVTDKWRLELAAVKKFVDDDPMELYFLEANNRFEEAAGLSVLIHDMVRLGKSVSFVSADRQLARLLGHKLETLGISFDDSSGTPMAMTVTGRLLNMILDYSKSKEPARLIPLLSHPFVALEDRQNHLRQLRLLEEKILRNYPGLNPWQPRFLGDQSDYQAWVTSWRKKINWDIPKEQSLGEWFAWHEGCFKNLAGKNHHDIVTSLSNGFTNENEIFVKMGQIASERHDEKILSFEEYCCFWNSWLTREKAVSALINHHPQVRILGAIESRAQSADVIIQAGMNEGLWPSPSIPDMWLNRKLRTELGLETPERFVGLAAHDFISGLACAQWVLSRSKQIDGAPCVESRFLTRLKTLLKGANLGAYEAANARGAEVLARAQRLDLPQKILPAADRPSVKLPLSARPLKLSVTNIEKYVQNPYRFYVEKILGLRALNAVSSKLQPNVFGEIWHAFFESVATEFEIKNPLTVEKLQEVFKANYDDYQPSSMERFKFEYEFEKMLPEFLAGEKDRRTWASEIIAESSHARFARFSGMEIELTAKVDRIDLAQNGEWRIFDYKSGSSAPFNSVRLNFTNTQQLPISAYILAHSGYGKNCQALGIIRYRPKNKASFVVADYDAPKFEAELTQMFNGYFDIDKTWEINTKDPHSDGILHFARYGEWLPFQPSIVLELGP